MFNQDVSLRIFKIFTKYQLVINLNASTFKATDIHFDVL